MAEAQAVDRVHRIGQTRDVKITRYIIKDSVEEVGCVCYLVSHIAGEPYPYQLCLD
jgi:hypothetical protein